MRRNVAVALLVGTALIYGSSLAAEEPRPILSAQSVAHDYLAGRYIVAFPQKVEDYAQPTTTIDAVISGKGGLMNCKVSLAKAGLSQDWKVTWSKCE